LSKQLGYLVVRSTCETEKPSSRTFVCEVRLAQIVRKGTAFNTCTITFTVGKAELRAEETTLHMYAALDIAAVQVERQLADFVATQHKHRLSTRLKRHFRRDAD